MNLNCYLVDDEPHALRVLADFIAETPGLTMLGSSTRPLTALEKITDLTPELTFLDIDMPEIGGLELAALVKPFTTVVFTTSYREYAPEAFEKEAADYLLKPISYERFLTCIQRIRKNIKKSNTARDNEQRSFFVKTGIRGQLKRICSKDIIYVASALNYVELFMSDQKIMTYLSIAEIVDKLPGDSFSRIHKSFVVNHNFISSVEHGSVKLADHTILPIGRAFRSAFMQKINAEIVISKWEPKG